MVQDSVSPVSFFDVSSKSNSKGKNDDGTAAGSENFGSALARASDSPSHPLKALKTSNSMDKPKLGNREPFFPHKPMPYHPDEAAGPNANGPLRIQTVGAMRGSTPMTADVESGSDRLEAEDVWDTTGHAAPEIDDRTGVIGQSYEGTAVSYPVSRIAKDSLDEKTKDALEKQGLWNLPTMVMAQPSQKTLMMKDFVGEGMRGSSVPVQKPIAQFMASLENELGVTPDRLVQAFQNLPAGQLQLPPEQTMIQVVKELGLKGEEATKAVELYSKMLAQMQVLDGKEKLQAAPLMAGGLTGGKIEQQVENLAQAAESPQSIQGSNAPQLKDRTAFSGKEPVKMTPLAEKNGDVNQSGDKLVKNADGKGMDVKGMSYENMKGQDGQSTSSQNQNPQGFMSQGQNQNKMTASHEQAPVKDQVKFDLKHDVAAEKSAKLDKPMMDLNSNVSGQSVEPKFQTQSTGPVVSGTAVNELKADGNSKHEAIQSIINNAQMLASKGGGEMHMTLKPEHLGEIQLRVAMDGNHVNVQMVTERGEVKKLIEQSVHELRHGLAQHDLSMNKLDVSVGDRSAGSFKQGMPDFGAARDFANQFHQQNGRREMQEDLLALRSNARGMQNPVDSGREAGLQAMSSAARHSRYGAARSSGRLNVVA